MYAYVGNDPINKMDPNGMQEMATGCTEMKNGGFSCSGALPSSESSSDSSKKTDPLVAHVKQQARNPEWRGKMKKGEQYGVMYLKQNQIKTSFSTFRKGNTVKTDDVNEALRNARKDGAQKYLGEVHNHPGSWVPSPKDVAGANELYKKVGPDFRAFIITPSLTVKEWNPSTDDEREAINSVVDHGSIDDE